MPLTICKQCVFYAPKRAAFDSYNDPSIKGACRRHPPSCYAAAVNESHDEWVSGYPHVEPDDGCGDGEEKKDRSGG